jgi:hypothetical protein
MLEERNRLCVLLEREDVSCPILPRWLAPLVGVVDMTGDPLTWLDAPSMPDEDGLLNEFLARPSTSAVSVPASTEVGHAALVERARALLDMVGLRGAVMILAHAGHGNLLGLQSSFTDDGMPGHDLRADHEALFMQVAATGVTATLLGSSAAVPDLWPSDVEREPFLQRAVDLTADVATAAAAIHRLGAARRATPQAVKGTAPRRNQLLRPGVILSVEDLLPDVNSADEVITAAETYYDLAKGLVIDLRKHGQSNFHSLLAYTGAHSQLSAVMSTYNQPGSEVIAVFAARMLLEEAARIRWLFSTASDEALFEERSKQFFDEFRARRKKAIATLTSSGVPHADAQRIFTLPDRVITPNDKIAKGRKQLPPISQMLREMGEPFPEPGWLEVAYSLLSQFTHSTPIGHLHTVRFYDDTAHGNEISPEMLGLSLDVACLGSAHLIGLSAVLLTQGNSEARQHHEDLLRQAGAVHSAARWVHGLD